MSPLLCVIDDDSIHHFTTKKIAERVGIEKSLLLFTEAKVAFEYLVENRERENSLPDCLFLDINMPIMDGWQFLAALENVFSSFTKQFPIFMVSSSLDELDTERAAQNRIVTGYILKPLTKEKLLESISQLQS